MLRSTATQNAVSQIIIEVNQHFSGTKNNIINFKKGIIISTISYVSLWSVPEQSTDWQFSCCFTWFLGC